MPTEKRIAEALKELCIPPHILGYTYIKQAILICLDNPGAIHAVTKLLYPAIADANGTTWGRVEKAIRHAIDISIGNCPMCYLNKYVDTVNKPTCPNSYYIASVVETLRLEENDG